MATVPVSKISSVPALPAPSTPFRNERRATPESFGAASGRALQGLGQDVQRTSSVLFEIARVEQEQDNQREAKELEVQLSQSIRGIGYGDGQQDPGFYALGGSAALDARADAEERMKKEAQRIAALASNPNVRERFDAQALVRLENEFERVGRHIATQRQVANDQASDARIFEAVSNVALNPELFEEGIRIAQAEVLSQGLQKGWFDENGDLNDIGQRKLIEAQTTIIQAAVDGAIKQGRIGFANAILRTNLDRIDGVIAIELMGSLKTQNDLIVIQEWADSLEGLGLSLSDEQKLARDTFSGTQEREALKEVSIRNGEAEAADEAALDDAFGKAASHIGATQGDLDGWIRDNDGLWKIIQGHPDKEAALKLHASRARLGEIFRDETDGVTFNSLLDLSPQQFAEVPLVQHQQNLTRQEDKEINQLQRGARAFVAAEGVDAAAFNVVEEAVERLAPNSARKTGGEIDKTTVAYRSLLLQMYGWAAEQQEAGKVITTPDAVNRLLEISNAAQNTQPGIFGRDPIIGAQALPSEFSVFTKEGRLIDRETITVTSDQLKTQPLLTARVGEALGNAGKDASDKELIENLAGAIISENNERIDRILGVTLEAIEANPDFRTDILNTLRENGLEPTDALILELARATIAGDDRRSNDILDGKFTE